MTRLLGPLEGRACHVCRTTFDNPSRFTAYDKRLPPFVAYHRQLTLAAPVLPLEIRARRPKVHLVPCHGFSATGLGDGDLRMDKLAPRKRGSHEGKQ